MTLSKPPSGTAQSLSAAFIEQIRQKLQPLLDATYNKRYSQAQAYVNGVSTAKAVIAAQTSTITSTGTFGPYAITFAPVAFTTVPVVVAWASLSSASNFVFLSVTSVSATGFQFDAAAFSPTIVAMTSGDTATVEWIAVGS